MRFEPNVFDVWVFRRGAEGVEFLLLYTSPQKAARYFNGGRFWQIPSNLLNISSRGAQHGVALQSRKIDPISRKRACRDQSLRQRDRHKNS